MATTITYSYSLTVTLSLILISLVPLASAQSNCLCPETSGVSVGVLVGACCAVLAGTILLEVIGYLAYQKWKKKRKKTENEHSEPAVAYSQSTAITIEEDGGTVPRNEVKRKPRSGSDSGRSSVYSISESMRSFFGDNDGGSRGNSVIETANDFEPLTDTYKIDWKTSADDTNLHDDYDVLERAFPILLPKLDAVDFTSARYKSTKINLIPEPQEITVGIAVEGDRTSRSSSSTRVYRTSNYGGRSRQSSSSRDDGRGGREHGQFSRGRSTEAVIEIEPDRPPTSRQSRIEIDENFSIANSRRSESSDEDLYDYGDTDGRHGNRGESSSGEAQRAVRRVEKREVLRRQAIEKRGKSLEGSAAMKASGARRAKSLVEEERSRSTHQGRSSGKREAVRGKDYHVVKREVVDGKEVVTLVRDDQSSSSTSATPRGLTRSISETGIDPRQKVSFRDPLESSDEPGIPTIGVIHLVESLDGSSDTSSYRRAPSRGRTTDRFQKKRVKRSRSESPIKYSERKAAELRESQETTTSSGAARGSHRTKSTTSSDRRSKTTDDASEVPTIGIVRLVSSTPNLDQDLGDSTWPRSVHRGETSSHRRTEESRSRARTGSSDRNRPRGTVDGKPRTKNVATEPRVSWKRLLDEMELILVREGDSVKQRSTGGKVRSTLSRLTSTRKEKPGKNERDKQRRHSLDRSGYKDDVTWEELLKDVADVDDRRREHHQGNRSSSAQSQSYTSKEEQSRTRSLSPSRYSSQTDRGRPATRHRSTTPEVAWDILIETVRQKVREEERRGRSPVRRSEPSTDRRRGLIDRGTQPEVSWGTLLRLVESRMEEKVNTERRYKKRAAPIVGKFSLKTERAPKSLVADMGTSPDLSWDDFIDIATAEAERNMKSRSVPDLRVPEGPQNIGMFSLKEKRQPKSPVRSTGTETDLSYTELVDIILKELNLIESERTDSRRSVSYDRERLLDRAKSLGVVHIRSKSEQRVPGKDFGTQPDLSWTQVIDIVKEETRRMLLKQKRDGTVEMGTGPIMDWNDLVETILEESEEFWRQRKKPMVDKGTRPNWSWSKIVKVIQEETEEVLRLRALSLLDSQGTQTESDSSSVAVSTLRTWVRDRPRRVQWEEGTEPQTEWESVVREIEVSAISHYIKDNGLDQPHEAPVVSVIKLKKDEELRARTTNTSTSPMIEWKSFVTEIQEDAIESTRKIIKREKEQQHRVPVAGVFKLKQEEQPTTKLLNSGTNPDQTWSDIITEMQEEFEDEYMHVIRKLQDRVDELEEMPKSANVVSTSTQPDWDWDAIVNRIQEETEETIIRHQRSKRQERLDIMLDSSAQTDVETKADASSQVAVMVHDKSSETSQQVNNVGLQVEIKTKTTDASLSFTQQSEDIGVDALVTHVKSIGTACAPTTTERYVTVLEEQHEVKSSSAEALPTCVSFGTVTDHTEVSSTAVQYESNVAVASVGITQEMRDEIQQTSFEAEALPTCVSFGTVTDHPDVSSTAVQYESNVAVASVGVTQEMRDEMQQTSSEVSDQSSMTDKVEKNVRENCLQFAAMQSTQSSQTESVETYDSYAMTDQVGKKEQSTHIVQEETVVATQEETVADAPDPNVGTYETWTYLDDYEEDEPVLTSIFTHQFGGVQTEDRSTLTTASTQGVSTETEPDELITKQTQVSVANETKGVLHAPETLPISTQTIEITIPSPLLVEKSCQQTHQTSQFGQNTTTPHSDQGSQASPDEQILIDQASLAKPLTDTLSTECDAESDIDSGIDMDCQTPPVMVFSIDEYQEIERDINDYRQMKKNVEEMEEEIRAYQETQKDILLLENEVKDYERLKTDVVTMETKIVEYQEMQKSMVDLQREINEYRERQKGMRELQERLKEFEDQDTPELVDAGIVTDILPSENFGTQTSGTPMKAWSSQTNIAVDDRSTSPVGLVVNDILSQTEPATTHDVFTQAEVEEAFNNDQATQAISDAREFGTVTDKAELKSVALQATVTSQETQSQYDRSEDSVGVQTEAQDTITQSSQSCQVTVNQNDFSTSTEVSMLKDMSTQSSAAVREVGAQYETSENDAGSQTSPKQTAEVATEAKAKVVHMEKQEADAASQTESVAVQSRMLDPIVRLVSEAQIQVEQPSISLAFKMTQTVSHLTSSTVQTDEVKKEVMEITTAPHREATDLVIQTEDVIKQTTSSQYDILSTTSVTQTDDRSIENTITQTEEITIDRRDAATSSVRDSNDVLLQTECVSVETTPTQYEADITSCFTQTEMEEKIVVEEASTSIDIVQKVSSEQTDTVLTNTQSVQYESDLCNIESQTEVLLTTDAGSNTIVIEEVIEEVDTTDSQIQCSAPTDFEETQTELVATTDSSCETDQKDIEVMDIGSQVTSAVMCDQQSQSEQQVQPLEIQTDSVALTDAATSARSPIATDDSSTQYEIIVPNNAETQYQASAEDYILQTEEVRLASIQMNTEPTPSSSSATQTEIEDKVMDDTSTQCEKSALSDMGTQYQASSMDNSLQTVISKNDFGMSCELVEEVIKKEEETLEASAPQTEMTTSLFQGQFDEEKTSQEVVGTTCHPIITTFGNQALPSTTIIGTAVAPETTDTGTLMDTEQTDTGQQMTPESDEKYSQVGAPSIQRAVSPISASTLTAATQIDVVPVSTSTLQIQVEDEESAKTIAEDVIYVSDIATQTRDVSLDTSTQTGVRETRQAAVASLHMERKVQRAVEVHPVQNTQATAAYTSVRREMGTQYITKEYEKKMDRRRDITLTDSGTYTDVATRTSSTTQTIITPRAQTGVQMAPITTSVGVVSNIKPLTAVEGVSTLPVAVRDVPVQKDSAPVTSKPTQIDRAPTVSRSISPNTLDKLEDDIIDDMKIMLTSQIREQVEAEYVNEILPTLVEQALREKVEREKRSRPRSQDAVTSPLRGRSVDRSFQHEHWPFTSTDAPETQKLGEREKQILRENTKKELRNELKPDVERDLRKEVDKEVRESVARDVEPDVRRGVARDVERSVREQVTEKVKNDVIRELKTDMRESVREDLIKEYKEDVFSRESEKMKVELTHTVRSELRPQLREEIEKELREDITREVKFENLKLVTSKNTVLVEKDTSTPATKSTITSTQTVSKTNNQGLQIHETKPSQIEVISQTQPVVMERGTTAQKYPLKEFSSQVKSSGEDAGTSPIAQVATTTFSAQMRQANVVQKHQSDQYDYTPTLIDEATQSAAWKLTADSNVQAVPEKEDKSVFGSLLLPSLASNLPKLTETRSQETQVHRTSGKSVEVQATRTLDYISSSAQVRPDTKQASFGTTAVMTNVSTQETKLVKDIPIQKDVNGTYRDNATSPETAIKHATSDGFVQMSPSVRDGSISPVEMMGPTLKPMISSEVQTLGKSYTSASSQFQPETKQASVDSKTTPQLTSSALQATQPRRDVPTQMGSTASYKASSTSTEQLLTTTSGIQAVRTMKDSSISPIGLHSEEFTRKVTKSSEMQTFADKRHVSSAMQYNPELKEASIGTRNAPQYTSTGLQATHPVRDIPIQMGSNATFSHRSTSPERSSVKTQSMQMSPASRDGAISPLPYLPDGSTQLANRVAKSFASSSMQFRPDTKHASTAGKAPTQQTSTGLQATRSVRDVPIQMGLQAINTNRSTSPHRAATNTSSSSMQFQSTTRDGSVSPVAMIAKETLREVRSTKEKSHPSSSMQFQPDTKQASIGYKPAVQHSSTQPETSRSVRDVPIQMGSRTSNKDRSSSPHRVLTNTSVQSTQSTPIRRDGAISPVDKEVGKTAPVQQFSTQIGSSKSVRDVPIQMELKTAKNSSTDPILAAPSTVNKASQFHKIMQDGSVSPVAQRKTAKEAEMQTKSGKYTSVSSQFQPETKVASVVHNAADTERRRSVRFEQVTRERSVSPVRQHVTARDTKAAATGHTTDTSSKSTHFEPAMRNSTNSPVPIYVEEVAKKSLKSAEMQTKDREYTSASSQFSPDTKTASTDRHQTSTTLSRSLQMGPQVRDSSMSHASLPIVHSQQKSVKSAEMQTQQKKYVAASSQFHLDTTTASVDHTPPVTATSNISVQSERVMRDGSISPVNLPIDQIPHKSVKTTEMQTKVTKYTSASSQFHPDTKTAGVDHKTPVAKTSNTSVQFGRNLRDGSISPVDLPFHRTRPTSVKTANMQTTDKKYSSSSSQVHPDTRTAAVDHKASAAETSNTAVQFERNSRDGSISPVDLPHDRTPPTSVKTANMQTSNKEYSSASSQFYPDTKTAAVDHKVSAAKTSNTSVQFERNSRDGSISPIDLPFDQTRPTSVKTANMQTADKKYSSASSQFYPDSKTAAVDHKASATNTSVQFERNSRDGSISPIDLPFDQTRPTSVKTANMQTADKKYSSASSQFYPDSKTAAVNHKASAAKTSNTSVQFERNSRDGSISPIDLPFDQTRPTSVKTANMQTADKKYSSASSQFYPDSKTAAVDHKASATNTSVQFERNSRDGSISPIDLPFDQTRPTSVKTANMQTADKKYSSASSQFYPDSKTAAVNHKASAAKTSNTSVQFERNSRDGSISPIDLPFDQTRPTSVKTANMQTADKKYSSASSQFYPDSKTAAVDHKASATNTSNTSVQFERNSRDGSISPIDLPFDRTRPTSVKTAEMQTKNKTYSATSSQFQPDTKSASVDHKTSAARTSDMSVQYEKKSRESSISPVGLPIDKPGPASVKTAEMQTRDKKYTSTASQLQPDTKTASVDHKTSVAKASNTSVQFERELRDTSISPVDLPSDKTGPTSMKTAEMQTNDKKYSSVSSQFHSDTKTSSMSVQFQKDTRDGSISPLEDLPSKSVKTAEMQTKAKECTSATSQFERNTIDGCISPIDSPDVKEHKSASSQFQPETKIASTGYRADVSRRVTSNRAMQIEPPTRERTSASSQVHPETKTASIGHVSATVDTSHRAVQFEPKKRDGAISPVPMPLQQKSLKTTSVGHQASVEPQMRDSSHSPVALPVDQKTVKTAEIQTSKQRVYTSTSSQFQPATKTASISHKEPVADQYQRSFQFELETRDGANSPVALPVGHKSVTVVPVDHKSVTVAHMQTSRDTKYSSSQFQPDTKIASIGHAGPHTSTRSMHFQPNTTTASLGPKSTTTSNRFVQMEPSVRDDGISPVTSPPAPPGSPILDQRKSLSTINEEPVKLSRTTKVQQSSSFSTSRLDEELYNLLKQAEKLGTVRRLPSTTRTTTITCVTTTNVTPSLARAVTTMLQQLPPRCRVVILHQSAPDVTYTTAVISTHHNTPTMSTGFHQSILSSRTSTFPAISGPPLSDPIAGLSDPEKDEPEVSYRGPQRTPSVRFADEDKPKGSHDVITRRSYRTTTKTTTDKRAGLSEVSNPTYGFRRVPPRGISTQLPGLFGYIPPETKPPTPGVRLSLATKPGIEGDVDTGDSETDSEPQLKSILRKPLSQSGRPTTILGRRTDPREDLSTESDESSVCDQYDISGESTNGPPKLPSLSSLSRERGTVKQDLSMSGVIASSKSTTKLTGFRQYDSSKAAYGSSKVPSSQYQGYASGSK